MLSSSHIRDLYVECTRGKLTLANCIGTWSAIFTRCSNADHLYPFSCRSIFCTQYDPRSITSVPRFSVCAKSVFCVCFCQNKKTLSPLMLLEFLFFDLLLCISGVFPVVIAFAFINHFKIF